MVCDQCARKLSDLVTVDNKNKRMFGNLKVESSKKYSNGRAANECLKCKGRAEGRNKYCLTCAYKGGMCEMCGKQLMNTKMYKYNDINIKDEKRKKKVMERSRLIAEEIIREKKLRKIEEKKAEKKEDKTEEKETCKETSQKEEVKEKKKFIPLINLDEEGKKEDSVKDEYDEVINL